MSTRIGQEAERLVAQYLEKLDFEILARNWKTKWCEIDIVAKRRECVHFVEVKYRRSGAQGMGLDYITHAKRAQLRRAAMAWVGENSWEGDFQIDTAGITGKLSLANLEIVWSAVED